MKTRSHFSAFQSFFGSLRPMTAALLILCLLCPLIPTMVDFPALAATGVSTGIDESPTDAARAPVIRTAGPADLGVSARAAVLFEAETGALYYAKNESVRLPMASTTKIMTALVVLESTDCPPDRSVTVTPAMTGVEGSSIYLQAGEVLTVRQLLCALLLESANDAAVALAITCAGSVEAFAAAMNHKAAELGLTDTHFTNPHGLPDDEHYTTAYELAKITQAALANPTFREIVSQYKITIPQNGDEGTRVLINHNKLLRRYDGCIGVKTGYTKTSGRCLVSAAEREGLTLIAVTLDAPNDWNDHESLLDWGYDHYASLLLAPAGGFRVPVPVTGSAEEQVWAVNREELRALLPRPWGEITYKVETRRFEYAPVETEQVLGRLTFYCEGEEIAACDLVALYGVPVLPAAKPGIWGRIAARLSALRDWIAAWFGGPLKSPK